MQHDVVLHKLLLDDRLSKEIQSNKINSNIINVVYSSIFPIDELQSLLFDGIQVKWNILNEIVKSQKFDSNVTINEFKDDYYINLDELINKKLVLNENKPILIHCQDEVIESQLNEYLKNIFLQHYVDEIDCSTINYTKFRNVANDSSMFYKALIDSKGKKFIVVYKNLNSDDDKNQLIYDLMNPNEDYYFEDLGVTINKNKMISVIITSNINAIPQSIIEMTNVISIKKLDNSEKYSAVKKVFDKKKEQYQCQAKFDNDIYDYLLAVPRGTLSVTMHKILNVVSNFDSSKQITASDIEKIFDNKTRQIGFI